MDDEDMKIYVPGASVPADPLSEDGVDTEEVRIWKPED